MSAPPVSKLAEKSQDKKVDELTATMAEQQKFVLDSVRKMEETSKAVMELVARATSSQDQTRGTFSKMKTF